MDGICIGEPSYELWCRYAKNTEWPDGKWFRWGSPSASRSEAQEWVHEVVRAAIEGRRLTPATLDGICIVERSARVV